MVRFVLVWHNGYIARKARKMPTVHIMYRGTKDERDFLAGNFRNIFHIRNDFARQRGRLVSGRPLDK